MRRSSPPYKANRRFAVGWNVGERKPHKTEGDCGFLNPEDANSVRSAYCLLCEVPPVHYYLFTLLINTYGILNFIPVWLSEYSLNSFSTNP